MAPSCDPSEGGGESSPADFIRSAQVSSSCFWFYSSLRTVLQGGEQHDPICRWGNWSYSSRVTQLVRGLSGTHNKQLLPNSETNSQCLISKPQSYEDPRCLLELQPWAGKGRWQKCSGKRSLLTMTQTENPIYTLTIMVILLFPVQSHAERPCSNCI